MEINNHNQQSIGNQQSARSALNPHIRIILAAGIYPPDSGGPATYSQLIAREFIKLGIEVSLICYSDQQHPESDKSEKFKIVRILRKQNKIKIYCSYLCNLLKLAKNADVIYAQGPLAAGFPAMWVSKILRKKFVVKIVGDYAWEQYQNEKSKIQNPKSKIDLIDEFQTKKYDWKTELRRKIQKFVCKKTQTIIVPSEYLKKIVMGWGVDEDKIKVIYNSFDGTQDTRYKIQDTNPNKNVIISAGRNEPWKGFDTLREIFPDLLKINPKFKLMIEHKMPHKELMANFKAGEMFVLNTGYEGFSHMLLEAMACGLPIITTNVCGNPEIIQNEENGLLVEYNNKEQLKNTIIKLHTDKDLKEKIIENGYKTLEKFTLERMINETKDILFESTN